jgi:type II secretory pathway component PulF
VDESLGPFNLVLLALPGLALKLAVRIMYGSRAYAVADPLKILLSVASTVLIVLAILGATIGLVGLWWTLIPIIIIFGIALLMAFDRHRHGEHRALVWTLASAAERGIPLPEAARAFADEMQDDTGARSLALAQSLEAGQPLSLAVKAARLRLSTPIAVAIRLGESLGMLGPAMRQQLQDASDVDAMIHRVAVRFFYLFLVILSLVGTLTFVSLRIVPVFQRMFEEFGLKLPRMTMVLIDASDWFIRIGWLITLPVTLALFLVSVVILFQALMSIAGWLPRDLPLIWRFFKRYDGAIVMRGLALTVRRGLPLPDGLKLLAATYPIRRIGRQIAIAHARVMQGADWRHSLLVAGIITHTDAAVLAAAERVGNLPWALEEMADSTLRRQLYGMQVAMQLLYPFLVILVGALVGFFVIGLFLPLLSLIQGLS